MIETEREIYGYIETKLDKARVFCKKWHDNIEHWRDLYNFKHYKGRKAKESETQFADPTYTNTVDLAVGIFMANGKQWVATGWNPTRKEQKTTDTIEKFLAGVIETNSDRYQCDLDYEINLHFTRDGCGILYAPWDRATHASSIVVEPVMNFDQEQISATPTAILTEIPIHTRVIDPLNVFLLPGGSKRWSMISRCEEASVLDIENEFGVVLKNFAHLSNKDKMNQKGRFTDYWEITNVATPNGAKSVVRNAVLFNDEFILHPEDPLMVMVGYDDLPYTISFYKPTSRDKADDWSSILQPLEPTVSILERNMNRLQRQVDVYSSLPLVAKTAGNTPISVDPGIGDVVNLGLDDRLELPAWSGNPPDVHQLLDFLRSRVQQSGFSDVMYGGGASSMSGYAISQLGDQSRIRLEQPITHLERLWTWWARKVIDLTVKFAPGMNIRVYGKLRGSDFADLVKVDEISGYSVRCEIKPEFPNERVRNHAMASQVKGIISNSTLMQNYLGIQQPEDERRRILIEAAEQNPVSQQYALYKTLLEMAEDGDQAAVMAIEAMKAQGVGNKGGRPTEPTNAMQPTGLQSSTGQASPQAQGNPQPGGSEVDAMNNMANAAPNMSGGVMQ